MECLKLCVAFGLASVARGSASVGPLSYLLQYKRSVLAGPTGLAAFNGFGGAPFDFAAAYGQPGFAAAYGQPGFAAAYGLDDLRSYQARALAPAAQFQYGAQPVYGFHAAPATGYPFVVHYGPSPATPQLLRAPDAQQPRPAPSAAPRHPAQDMARPMSPMSPTVAVAAESAARIQMPSSYQPVPTGGPAAAPDLFLELTPPHYSEPSIDYSKSAAPSTGPDSNRGPYPSVPFGNGVQGASSPSNAYLVPSISYSLPTMTYSHTEPNAVNGHGKTAPAPVPDAPPSDFASNALYGDSDSGGPVPGSFSDAYYGVDSSPTSAADTYGDPNSIRSGSHRGNDHGTPIAGNVRSGDPTPSDKRETPSNHLGRADKRSPIKYFGGDFKNVQRDTY